MKNNAGNYAAPPTLATDEHKRRKDCLSLFIASSALGPLRPIRTSGNKGACEKRDRSPSPIGSAAHGSTVDRR